MEVLIRPLSFKATVKLLCSTDGAEAVFYENEVFQLLH